MLFLWKINKRDNKHGTIVPDTYHIMDDPDSYSAKRVVTAKVSTPTSGAKVTMVSGKWDENMLSIALAVLGEWEQHRVDIDPVTFYNMFSASRLELPSRGYSKVISKVVSIVDFHGVDEILRFINRWVDHEVRYAWFDFEGEIEKTFRAVARMVDEDAYNEVLSGVYSSDERTRRHVSIQKARKEIEKLYKDVF